MITDWNRRALGPARFTATVNSEPEPVAGSASAAVVSEEVLAPAAAPAPPAELLEGWFRDYFARLWRLVARLGVASQGIDDVVQESFITASRRHADIRDGREWAFLVGTALRLSANHRMRAAARREVVKGELIEQEASPLPDAEQVLIDKRKRQELDQALSALSKEQRQIFVLYELEGFSAPEIAELLALPLGTVASRLGRARSKFSETAARMRRARLARPEET